MKAENITTEKALDAFEAEVEARVAQMQEQFFACQEREAKELGDRATVESVHQQQDAANQWAADADQFLAQAKQSGQEQLALALRPKRDLEEAQVTAVSGFGTSLPTATNASGTESWRRDPQPPRNCAEVQKWCNEAVGAAATAVNERQQCAAHYNAQLRCPSKTAPIKIDVR